MKHFFYPRLALSNIRKNKQVYFPYLLASTFTVSMFYMIHSLYMSKGYENMEVGGSTLPFILELGSWVVVIFSVIFLFYINSFLMKRRKREIALYNILGMEKKHVMFMMFFETLFVSVFSIIVGILFGMLLSRLLFLTLIKLAQLSTTLNYTIPYESIMMTVGIYMAIFMVSYLFHVIQIKITNPIELLRGSDVGEKEPKTKWFMALIGFITLGSGYYIAQTIEEPVTAMLLFFIAVILVIIGTYCLFTAGSILILKVLKKNKHFYYQTKHFTSVSQLIYRMKQNAVGLASICILCTCILVMLSSTVSLYISVQDSSQMIQDEQLKVSAFNIKEDEFDDYYIKVLSDFKKNNIELTKSRIKKGYFVAPIYRNDEIIVGEGNDEFYSELFATSLKDYEYGFHHQETLNNNEILVADNCIGLKDQVKINGKTFKIKKVVNEDYFLVHTNKNVEHCISIVFKNDQIIQDTLFSEDFSATKMTSMSMDFKDIKMTPEAQEILFKYANGEIYTQSVYDIQQEYIEIFGSLFFLGIFLGILFLMATILIMYYKQLSEGYEDQKRYEIMQNVGMSQKEVKQSINSQVLIFFFLPLLVAVLHMAFAFKMIVKMFSFLVLSETSLFVVCTIISAIILAIIYSIVYMLTSRIYYKIVSVH